jgi:hypothetical protein
MFKNLDLRFETGLITYFALNRNEIFNSAGYKRKTEKGFWGVLTTF